MKQFLVQQRHSIWAKALSSSATISLFLYIIIRGFTYDFPMSWGEEILFFIKINFTSIMVLSLAMVSCASLYSAYERIKKQKKAA